VIARRLAVAGCAVTALLVVAGIASHGRPLAGGRGSGPNATFFDYFATTLFILAVAMLALVVWAVAVKPTGGGPPARSRWHILSTLLTFAAAALLGAFILRHSDLTNRLRAAADKSGRPSAHAARANGKEVRDPRLRWDEIAIVLALAGGTVLVMLATRRTRRAPAWSLRREADVSQALDDSIDDLRTDPDLRRAIVAAYARMERALAGSGVARHPAEAPFEYMERALTSLDASADAAERLTALFEWAKFSQHEPRPAMRDEAIDALVAVRDDLRRPAERVTA
jgi:Domain of unknown function (DUF4129)